MPDPDDAEVKEAIRYSISRTVSGIVAELAARFPPDRTWPWEMVRDEVAAQRRGVHRKDGFGANAALQHFIADRPPRHH